MRLPDKYQIQDGLVPEWIGRREFYEVVEELGDSLWWLGVFLSYALIPWLLSYTVPLWFWLLVGFICLAIAMPTYVEFEKWLSEVYVVASDQQGGGWVYKFTGILNFTRREIPITSKSPVPLVEEYENNIFYWVWKKTTKRRMQKVTLKSAEGYTFLNGNRMSPEFMKAIERVRGNPSTKKDIPPFWQNADGLARAKNSGLVEEQEAKYKFEQMWREMMG